MKALVFLLASAALLGAHPDPRHSLEHIEEHLVDAPGDPVLLRRKAELLLSLEQPEPARRAIAELIEMEPDEPGNRLLEARLSHATGERKAAREQALALTRRHPGFADGWRFLARIEDEWGRRDEAIRAMLRYLQAAAKPAPGEVTSCATWLRERAGPGDAEAAVGVIDRALAKLGNVGGLQMMAIDLEVELARFDAALNRIDTLTARSRPSVDLSLGRAAILEKAGRHAEAAAACDNALAIIDALPAGRRTRPELRGLRKTVARRKVDNARRAR